MVSELWRGQAFVCQHRERERERQGEKERNREGERETKRDKERVRERVRERGVWCFPLTWMCHGESLWSVSPPLLPPPSTCFPPHPLITLLSSTYNESDVLEQPYLSLNKHNDIACGVFYRCVIACAHALDTCTTTHWESNTHTHTHTHTLQTLMS